MVDSKDGFRPIKLRPFKLSDSRFSYSNGSGWYADRLVQHASGLPVFELPLRHIDLSMMPFKVPDVLTMAEHCQRVLKTNLGYPVIMDQYGYIIDGWHRVIQALVRRRPIIRAVRFDEDPDFDFFGQ